MIDTEKAKLILEKLRVRTEARGATAAEAVQAAQLAEKVARRYGLDINPIDGARSHIISEKRLPSWVKILLWAMDRKFGIQITYRYGLGRPVEIKFVGPDHLTNVAVWLFKAIRNDLDKQSYVAARAMGKKGGALVRFRNQFRVAAAWELHARLNPPPEAAIAEAEKRQASKSNQSRRKPKNKTMAQLQQEADDWKAMLYGTKAGKQISIDTNVLPQQDRAKITHV